MKVSRRDRASFQRPARRFARRFGRPRPSNRRAIRLCLTIGATLAFASACNSAPDEAPPEAWARIGAQQVAVELAETPSEQAKGLGYRDGLEWDHGMFFIYERPALYRFWMRGMRFSIDIVWIRDGRIVDLHRSVPFELGGNGPTVAPQEVVDAVLEVPAGYAAASGWGIGDRVVLERTVRSTDNR